MVSIYMLTDPTGADTCYVGRSVHPTVRYKAHLSESGAGKKVAWIRMLKSRGLKPALVVLDAVASTESEQAEADAIAMESDTRRTPA